MEGCYERVFQKNSDKSKFGIRTRYFAEYIAERILKYNNLYTEKEAKERAENILIQSGMKIGTGDNKVVYFFGESQIENIAKIAADSKFKIVKPDKVKKGEREKLQKILNEGLYIDIALFGRMVAGEEGLRVDASSQVAHAISTHGVQAEFDYFIAKDELPNYGSNGAAMIGNAEYNSSTLYRYANIALHEFLNQLKDKESMIDNTKLFVEAFVKSLPSGKINSHANQTLPSILVINLRTDRPVSLVTAFEKPVELNEGEGYVKDSVKKLVDEIGRVEKFVDKPLKTLYLSIDDIDIAEDEEAKTFEDLFEKLGAEIENYQFD